MRVGFLVTPVGLMMGNVKSARRLKEALSRRGVGVVTNPDSETVDILHVHTPVPPGNFRIVKRLKREGVPVIMHAHTTAEDSIGTWTGSEFFSGVTGKYLTRFYNLGDLVLAPSAWTKSRLEARGVTAPIRVLSNGVDLNRFSFDGERRRKFRARYGIPDHTKVVYSIGVLCLKKGIETFPEVANSFPDIQFLWVGRKSRLYHPMKVNLAVSKCGDNARFLTDVDDIADAHCGGDIFFSPSFTENQGMAVMEAMSVGRAVVCRNLPSYEGLLVDGSNCLLGRNPMELTASISRLLADPSLAASLADEAKSSIRSHNIDHVAQELEAIYTEILGARRETV